MSTISKVKRDSSAAKTTANQQVIVDALVRLGPSSTEAIAEDIGWTRARVQGTCLQLRARRRVDSYGTSHDGDLRWKLLPLPHEQPGVTIRRTRRINARTVLAYLQQHGPATPFAISRGLGVDGPEVCSALRGLEAARTVHRLGHGGSYQVVS